MLTDDEKQRIRAMTFLDREYLAGYLEGVLGPAWEDIPADKSHAAELLRFINQLNSQH